MSEHDGGEGKGAGAGPDGPRAGRRLWTVPNALCAIRLAGAPVLVALAATGRETAFLLAFLFLMSTDWIDGKLAIWLDQRSSLGARLDTAADVAMYGSLLLGLLWLRGALLVDEWPWIAAGGASWVASAGAGLARFRRLPSYHTRLAKTSWLLALIGAVTLLVWEMIWPFRIAAAAVTLTNLEGLVLTALLPESRTDVSSLFRVLAERRRQGEGG